MDIIAILNTERSRLRRELDGIEKAMKVLRGVSNGARRRGARRMSAATKRRIAQAQKARWAKWRRKNRG